MVTWADADAAVEAERSRRIKRVENMTLITALTLLLCAIWLAWPSLRSLINGDGVVLTSFGAPLVLLIWGIFIQDLTLDDATARARAASASTVAWPLLLCLGAPALTKPSPPPPPVACSSCLQASPVANGLTGPCVATLASCGTGRF